MARYWSLLKTIQKGIHKLEILSRMSDSEYVRAIMTQYQHMESEFDKINELLVLNQGPQSVKRSKRGLVNGVGIAARYLFGVLDEKYAAQVSETIRKVQDNEEHLYQLMRNQTSVLEATEEIMKKSETEIGQQMKAVESAFQDSLEKMKNMTIEVRNQKVYQTILTLTILLTLMTTEYQKIQATLIDTVLDAHHGRMNPRIMSNDKLRAQISVISEHLPPSLDIPSRDTTQLYKVMSVRCIVNKDYTIFVVRLPLVLRTEFELYKIIPLPSLVNNTYVSIIPSTELLMIDLQKDLFYALTSAELASCVIMENEIHICSQLHPIYNRNSAMFRCEAEMINQQGISDDCILGITTPRKVWIQLSKANHWLYSLDKEYVYNIVCEDRAFQQVLSGSGLLTFKKRCIMKDEDTIINSHNSFQTKLNITFTPRFNLTTEISLPHNLKLNNSVQWTALYRDHTKELTKLQTRLSDIRQAEDSLVRSSQHDIHQYTVGYSALGIAIVIAIVVGYLYHKFRTLPWQIIMAEAREKRPAISLVEFKPTPAPRNSNILTEEDFKIEVGNFKRGENVETHS